jgi:hypothetical protein
MQIPTIQSRIDFFRIGVLFTRYLAQRTLTTQRWSLFSKRTTLARAVPIRIPGMRCLTPQQPQLKERSSFRSAHASKWVPSITATPIELYSSLNDCLENNRDADAVSLFVLAGMDSSFDSVRVSDKTAGLDAHSNWYP